MKLFVLFFTLCALPIVSLAQNEFNFCGHTKSISYAELKKCPRLTMGNDSIYKVASIVVSYHLNDQDHTDILSGGVIKQEMIATFERHKVKNFTIELVRARTKGFDQPLVVKMNPITIELTPIILLPPNK